MDLRIRQLRYFAMLAATLDLKRASAALEIPRSTLQFQIRSLAESFSVELFVRNKGRLQLTPAGQKLLASTDRILQAVGLIEEQMRRVEPNLSLNLCSSQAGQESMLSTLLHYLRDEQPELVVEVLTMAPDERIQALLAGEVDLLMMVPPTRAPGVVFQHLVSNPQYAIVPDVARFRSMRSISIYDFARNPILLARDGECSYARRFVLANLERFSIVAKTIDVPVYRSNMIAMIAAGRAVGFGYGPYWGPAPPGVRYLDFDEELPLSPLGMVWRAHDTSKAVALVRQALVDLTLAQHTTTLSEFPLYARLPNATEIECRHSHAG